MRKQKELSQRWQQRTTARAAEAAEPELLKSEEERERHGINADYSASQSEATTDAEESSAVENGGDSSDEEDAALAAEIEEAVRRADDPASEAARPTAVALSASGPAPPASRRQVSLVCTRSLMRLRTPSYRLHLPRNARVQKQLVCRRVGEPSLLPLRV